MRTEYEATTWKLTGCEAKMRQLDLKIQLLAAKPEK